MASKKYPMYLDMPGTDELVKKYSPYKSKKEAAAKKKKRK